MTQKEKKANIKYNLEDIGLNQCKLIEIKGEKVAVCNDDGELSFYKIKPLQK